MYPLFSLQSSLAQVPKRSWSDLITTQSWGKKRKCNLVQWIFFSTRMLAFLLQTSRPYLSFSSDFLFNRYSNKPAKISLVFSVTIPFTSIYCCVFLWFQFFLDVFLCVSSLPSDHEVLHLPSSRIRKAGSYPPTPTRLQWSNTLSRTRSCSFANEPLLPLTREWWHRVKDIPGLYNHSI